MLYVGIDQHKRHLTICVRDEQGEIALRRQVSTKWEEVDRFLVLLQERVAEHGGHVAVIRFLLAQMVLHALRGDPGLRRWYLG